MQRLRNRDMSLLAVVIAVINTVVFIINPQQVNSVIEEQTAHSSISHHEGIISTSSGSELYIPDQNIPLYEFKYESKVFVNPAPRYMQPFQLINRFETGLIRSWASGYLTRSARPEPDGIELIILHHRLNT